MISPVSAVTPASDEADHHGDRHVEAHPPHQLHTANERERQGEYDDQRLGYDPTMGCNADAVARPKN
jgi:hypothetical protein